MSTKEEKKDYTPNGEIAKKIARSYPNTISQNSGSFCLNIVRNRSVTPYFPFKGIKKFYDIGGFLK
eukprot:1318615-Amorphochlora_amoeboformis.AAC.1